MNSQSSGRVARSYLREHKGLFLWALFWRGLYVIVPMQVPVITGAIVDGLTNKDVAVFGITWQQPDPMHVIWMSVLCLFGVAAAYGISSYVRLMAAAHLSRHFVFDLRQKIVRHTARLSIEQHQQFGAAELLDRTLTDTRQMRRFLDRVYIQSTANFLRIGYPIGMMLVLDWSLALIALSILVPQWLISRQFHRKLHMAADQRRRSQSQLTSVIKESLDGVETIKSLDADTSSVAVIQPCATRLEKDELRQNRWGAMVNANVWFMTSIGVALVWGLGGARVMEGRMTLGGLVVFTGFMAFVYQPFRQFTAIVTTYREGLVSLERISDLLQVEPSIRQRPDSKPLEIHEGQIQLHGVSFSYGGGPVISDVDVQIAPRQMTAVVGRSGSGKTTLLRLVQRLYDPDRGDVAIDGQISTDVTLDSVRSQVAMVTQHPMIFTGTLLDNMRLARPEASLAEIQRACQAAGALDFVQQLDQGFDTRVGTGGANLSGGQIQRLAIARALLNCPRILLLDEPTSALDAESEAAIVATMKRLRKFMTVVVVAHRPMTACCADRLIVMDDGRVVADGTHDVLADQCEIYQDLFSIHELSHAGAA